MGTSDATREVQLDLALDRPRDDAGAADGTVDAEMSATLRQLQALAARPVPDPAFVQRLGRRLGEAAMGMESVDRDAPRAMTRARTFAVANGVPRSFGMTTSAQRSPQHDPPCEPPLRPAMSANGHMRPAPLLPVPVSGSPARPWWQRLEIAAAVLIVAVLGAYLVVADLGRTPAQPSHLDSIAARADEGVVPVGLRIEAIGVDANIKELQPASNDIATPVASDIWTVGWGDGGPVPMPEPSEPWDVAWLKGSPAPGAGSNVVLRGHLDYWDFGNAVFWDLHKLAVGDRIEVTGEDGVVFAYAVDWWRQYPIAAGEDAQREILGPTAGERLTLMTSAGKFDAKAKNYPEVLIVRARFLGTSALRTVFVPDPQECQAAPVSVAALEAAATRVAPRPRHDPSPTSLSGEEIQAVDAATMDAVIAAEREIVACLNADDPLRGLAHYTDAGLDRLLQWISPDFGPSFSGEWAPDFSELNGPATPRPANEWLALLAVDDVRILPDGRMAALVTIGPGESKVFGVPTGRPVVHIFAPGERLMIDDFIIPGLATPTPS